MNLLRQKVHQIHTETYNDDMGHILEWLTTFQSGETNKQKKKLYLFKSHVILKLYDFKKEIFKEYT